MVLLPGKQVLFCLSIAIIMARFVVTIKYFLFTACIIYDSAAHATPRTPKISMAPTTTTLAVSIQDRCNVALTAQTAWSWRDAINSPIAPQFQHNFTRAVPLLPSGHETSGYHFFITAEPGTGKTTLVQQLANHWAHTRHGSGGGAYRSTSIWSPSLTNQSPNSRLRHTTLPNVFYPLS